MSTSLHTSKTTHVVGLATSGFVALAAASLGGACSSNSPTPTQNTASGSSTGATSGSGSGSPATTGSLPSTGSASGSTSGTVVGSGTSSGMTSTGAASGVGSGTTASAGAGSGTTASAGAGSGTTASAGAGSGTTVGSGTTAASGTTAPATPQSCTAPASAAITWQGTCAAACMNGTGCPTGGPPASATACLISAANPAAASGLDQIPDNALLPPYGVDGDPTTRFTSGQPQLGCEYYAFDMCRMVSINGINLITAPAGSNDITDVPTSYTVQVSTDA